MADFPVAQRYADVSRFRQVLVARVAIRFRKQCARLGLGRSEERPHPVMNDQHLGLDRLPVKASQLWLRGW